jgi:glycosyltransferase involved in cell wall biosynthesis
MKSEKIKLLCVHASAAWFGSDRYLYGILKYLDTTRFDAQVILPEPGPLKEKIQALGIPVVHPPCMGILHRFRNPVQMAQFFMKLFAEIVWLIRFIRKQKIQLVHVNSTSNLGGLIAARICRVPVVCHALEIRISPALIGKILATLVNGLSTHIVAISQAVSDYLDSGWTPPRSLQVLHPGVELDSSFAGDSAQVREQLEIPKDIKVVGMVGRLTFWKGAHVFIEAAMTLAEKRSDAFFLIVGAFDTAQSREYYQSLVDKVHQRGLTDRIRFLGFREDIPAVMSVFDIFILPSVFPEPFGLVTVDAMLAGKPAIATRHGGSLDIVREGTDGFLVPPGEPEALAEKVEILLNDPELRQEMGRNGKIRIQEHFGLKDQVREIMNAYTRMMEPTS